jgi:excisionase family DNA binding protein
VLPETMIEEERRQARLHASQHAHYGGQEPPKEMGLLIGKREAADLFGVSEGTVANWIKTERMPAPIRIGRAVRWGYEELRAWVNAGCPPQKEWNRRPAQLKVDPST